MLHVIPFPIGSNGHCTCRTSNGLVRLNLRACHQLAPIVGHTRTGRALNGRGRLRPVNRAHPAARRRPPRPRGSPVRWLRA